MPKKRSKNLSDVAILQIVEIIDGLPGKITWHDLIDAIELRLYSRYTRQALFKHERIRLAFELAQNRGAPTQAKLAGRKRSVEMQLVEQQLARLKAENARLTAENQRLLEQFVRWAYNAFTRGLDEVFLSQPLPGIDRGKTPEPAR